MEHLDVPAADRPAVFDALRGHAMVETEVSVLDLDGNLLGNLSPEVSDGQILVDRHGKVARALRMTFDDPTGQLDFASNTPDDGALSLTRMLQVQERVYVDTLNQWVTFTPFTGPLRKLWRDGARINVQAHSKDRLSRRPLGGVLTIPQGTPKTDAIRIILEWYGETQFAFPDLDATLPRELSLGPADIGWVECQRLAQSMDVHLYYRADGPAAIRRLPRAPLYTFRTGEGGDVVGRPRVSYELDDNFANTLHIYGPLPRGNNTRIFRTVALPEDHDLSPQAFTRGGKQQPIIRTVVNHRLTSEAEADQLGDRMLNDILLEVTRPQFQCTPIWPFTEGDFAQLETEENMIPFRLDRFTLPVSVHPQAQHLMTVGAQVNTTADRDDW